MLALLSRGCGEEKKTAEKRGKGLGNSGRRALYESWSIVVGIRGFLV